MVDDNEFVKRRHLSRGRPRKYDPSPSPTGDGQSNTSHNHNSNSSTTAGNTTNNHPGSFGIDEHQLTEQHAYGSPANSTSSTPYLNDNADALPAPSSTSGSGVAQ